MNTLEFITGALMGVLAGIAVLACIHAKASLNRRKRELEALEMALRWHELQTTGKTTWTDEDGNCHTMKLSTYPPRQPRNLRREP